MRIKSLQFGRVLGVALLVLLMMVGMTNLMAQQPNQTKLTEYNFRNLNTIEERVFLLHSIQESEFFSYVLSNEEGKIDIYVSDHYTCQDSNANSDFDFFLENMYDEWNAYSNLDKTERGSLFVEWRFQLEDEVFLAINEDFNRQLRDGNSTCDGALEFSSLEGLYQFPASVNAGNLGSSTQPYWCSGFVRPNGGSTSCLSTTPNPAFYYMQIAEPGNLNIYMYSTPSHDIDFDCWGPFDDIETACSQLSCSKMVDCSYSASATENCYINNAQPGQYYILLITNYSNQPSTVCFQNIGTGGTGCSGQKTVSAVANFAERGTITGAGEYECGSSCTLTATANDGYVFMDWTNADGVVVSMDEEYTFTVWGNRNITANFVEDNACYLTFNLNDTNGDGWSGNYLVLNYEGGSSQKLTVPSGMSTSSFSLPFVDGSHISLGWNSGSNTSQCSFMVTYSNGNVIYYGTNLTNSFNYGFDVDCVGMPGNTMTFDVMAEASPLEGGAIVGVGQFGYNETCTLTAITNGGYEFVNWTEEGMVVSTSPTYSFSVGRNRNLMANFNPYENHWTVENYINDMFMIGVVQIDGIEQTSPSLELGAFCNGECRGTEFPVYEDGRWWYYMNIGGNSGDDITFRLYDHALQQELNLHCFNEIPFEYYGLIGIDDPYEVLFASLFTISVVVNPEDAGTVAGAGTYINGTEVTLTATPNNSTFINWTIGDEQVSTDMVYSFTVTDDLALVANFLPKYEVTVSVNPTEGGSISGAGIYDSGTECTLIATPNAGYAFGNWSIDGEIVSTEPSYTFTVTASVNLTANFGILYPVSATVSPEDAGIIIGEGIYVSGTSATLIAYPNEGYAFNSWTLDGEIVSTEPSYSFTVTNTMNFIANFNALYSVSATVNLENAGTIVGTGIYVSGTEATLIATANEGYAFNNWTLDGEVVSTEPAYTFTVTESVNLTANFNAIRTRQLAAGWNWWSTDLEITLQDLKDALVDALGTTASITIASQTRNCRLANGRWIGQLTSLDLSQMYIVSVDADCEITLKGVPFDPADHPATIKNGYNWIAYPLNQSMNINEALSGFPSVNNDIIQSHTNNTVYTRGQWRGALSAFVPGQGYIFKSVQTEDRVLTFPSNAK